MARKFIIHIGPAKTGTSSLQEALFKNRQFLLEHGYDFPGFGRHPDMQRLPGHHGIPDRLRRLGEVPPGVLENLAQFQDDRTFIFSSENLAHVPSAAVQTFVNALDADDIQVVYYARRWDHLIPSVWQELVKHGDSRPYLEFLNTVMGAPLANQYVNYANAIDNWAKVLGAQKIRIFSYDNVKSSGQGIVEHFCKEVMGMTLEREDEPRHNPRQNIGFTETVRLLNRLAFGGQVGTPAMRSALMQARSEVADELAELDALYRPYEKKAQICPPFLFCHVEQWFLKKYGAQVENLSENGRLFGDFQMEPTTYINQDYLLETDAAQKVRALMEIIR